MKNIYKSTSSQEKNSQNYKKNSHDPYSGLKPISTLLSTYKERYVVDIPEPSENISAQTECDLKTNIPQRTIEIQHITIPLDVKESKKYCNTPFFFTPLSAISKYNVDTKITMKFEDDRDLCERLKNGGKEPQYVQPNQVILPELKDLKKLNRFDTIVFMLILDLFFGDYAAYNQYMQKNGKYKLTFALNHLVKYIDQLKLNGSARMKTKRTIKALNNINSNFLKIFGYTQVINGYPYWTRLENVIKFNLENLEHIEIEIPFQFIEFIFKKYTKIEIEKLKPKGFSREEIAREVLAGIIFGRMKSGNLEQFEMKFERLFSYFIDPSNQKSIKSTTLKSKKCRLKRYFIDNHGVKIFRPKGQNKEIIVSLYVSTTLVNIHNIGLRTFSKLQFTKTELPIQNRISKK